MSGAKSREPYKVFISYSREDKHAVQQLRDLLDKESFVTYRDVDAIRAGDSFQHAITNAIDESSVVLCILSPAYLSSAWCRSEAEIAFAHQRPIIPILLEDTRVDGPLSYYNYLDLRDFRNLKKPELEQTLERLKSAIIRLASDVPRTSSEEQNGGIP